MGASRKLRRALVKENRIDQIRRENDIEIARYKDMLYDQFLGFYLVNIGLAVYDVYGNMPTRIQKIWEAFNKRIDSGQDFEQAQKELCDKTGIMFKIME